MLGLLLSISCEKEIKDLELSPWDLASDFEYVLIDSFHYEPSQAHVQITFHVDNSVLRPKPLYWLYFYRDGKYIRWEAFDGEGGVINDDDPISGATHNYHIRFIAHDGTNTKTFGPFPYTVP